MKNSCITRCLLLGALIAPMFAQLVKAQAETKGQNSVSAIDTHVHVDVPNPMIPIEGAPACYTDVWLAPEKEAAERLAQQMEEAHIGMVLLMGRLGVKGDPLGIKRNLKVMRLLSDRPEPKRAKLIGAIDPSRGSDSTQMKAVRQQLDEHRHDIVAFKAYLGYYGPPTHRGYEPFYRLALEYKIPTIFHTGPPWSYEARIADAHPLLIDDIAKKYPDLRIVMAHMGWPWHMDAAVVVYNNQNVWVDLSGLFVGPDGPLLEMIESGQVQSIPESTWVSALLESLTIINKYDRILYATDFPQDHQMSSYRRLIETIIPEQYHTKVFRGNAEELFGLDIRD